MSFTDHLRNTTLACLMLSQAWSLCALSPQLPGTLLASWSCFFVCLLVFALGTQFPVPLPPGGAFQNMCGAAAFKNAPAVQNICSLV